MLESPLFCRWGNWGLERWWHLFPRVSGGAGTAATQQHHLSTFDSSPLWTTASPPAACPYPLPLSWYVLGAAKSLQAPPQPGQTLGSPWRQQELSQGHGPINLVSFRGPFPRQRVIDTIISISFNANYFFSHVNIKIILNVLIKADVISDHRIINSAWERLSGEKMFSEPQMAMLSDLEYQVCMIFNH